MPCVHVLLLTFHAGGASGVVFLGGLWNSETADDSALVAAHGVQQGKERLKEYGERNSGRARPFLGRD
jgi:hypothetical protein